MILAGSVSESIEIRFPVSSHDLRCGARAIRGMFIVVHGEHSRIPGTGRELGDSDGSAFMRGLEA